MDKGMKKVVNLVTNYMSALCETGRVPGRVDRNIEAGTAVYFPGGGVLPSCVNARLECEIRAARYREPPRHVRLY